MDIDFIKNKASKKIFNSHYFNRYLRLINNFNDHNLENKELYPHLEEHHILPKANDMFPEYKNLKDHTWNSVYLNARQHYIAHWLLWKTFGGSQSYVFRCFNTQSKCRNNKRNKRRISSRVFDQLKKDQRQYMSEINKGLALYVDENGVKIKCKTDDPRVLSGELVAQSKGRKYKPRTEKQKLKTRVSLLKYHKEKENQPIIYLYNGIERVSVIKYSEEYYNRLNSGWFIKATPERRSYTSAESNKNRKKVVWSKESRDRVSKRLKGKKQSKSQIINATISRRNKSAWNKGDYDIFVYNKSNDIFETIDQLYFDDSIHMKVSKHIKNVSRKIVNINTKEKILVNPDLPRLPENYVFATDLKLVLTYEISTKNFIKIPKYLINEKYIEVFAPNKNRFKITDNNGVNRYVQKEIFEMM
jgi:hypothetical protein